MAPEITIEVLKARFGDKIAGANLESTHPQVLVAAPAWHDVASFLRTDDDLRVNLLRCITALDMVEDDELVAVYDLCAVRTPEEPEGLWEMGCSITVRIKVPRSDPHIPSVADVWRAADWHEREAYDLMGIIFDGHPDSVVSPEGQHPRRILCPDDWKGHPLRKDYRFPMEYHGIPAVTEYQQTRPTH